MLHMRHNILCSIPMRSLVIFSNAYHVSEKYQAAIRDRGIDADLVFVNRSGYGSSLYRAIAHECRGPGGRILPGLLERYASQIPQPLSYYDVIVIVSFSAGYGLWVEVLAVPEDADMIDGYVPIDSVHSGYDPDGTAKDVQLEPFRKLAVEAKMGAKILWLGHADVRTWRKFASTTEVANELRRLAGGEGGGFKIGSFDLVKDDAEEHRRALTRWGPDWLADALVCLRERRAEAGVDDEPTEPDPDPPDEPDDEPEVTESRPTIRRGDRGEAVERWQLELLERSYSLGRWGADGVFGAQTQLATMRYQLKARIAVDGIVGPQTWGSLDGAEPEPQPSEYPTRPDLPEPSQRLMEQLYGVIEYDQITDSNGSIRITNGWDYDNMTSVYLEQLKSIPGYHNAGRLFCHRLAVEPLKMLWKAWEAEGLSELVLSFDGLYNPRVVRGGSALSEHAFGAAFDINARWNPYRRDPSPPGALGSVAPLVRIANRLGWWWRGHSTPRDGMHFCLVRPEAVSSG